LDKEMSALKPDENTCTVGAEFIHPIDDPNGFEYESGDRPLAMQLTFIVTTSTKKSSTEDF
jgi:hypothetical protein